MHHDDDFQPLLGDAFAQAWQLAPTGDAARRRLLQRLAASQAAEAGMTTARRRRLRSESPAPGIGVQMLYSADDADACRPGEPLRVRLFELQPGALLDLVAIEGAARLPPRHCEWLLLRGELHAPALGKRLSARDYHVTPAGQDTPAWASEAGALLFLRESDLAAAPGDRPFTVHDDEAGWPAYAPGIERRVLWQRDGQAAMLYRAAPGAQVPHHTHGHDEECLMVDGELFLDDTLLQPGDYQLARAGTGHRVTATDTGVVIYAHGDLDLRFVA